MSSSSKVFIYSDEATSQETVDDLKELFTTDAILGHSPDVQESDFNFNCDQLTLPTLVVPGAESTRRLSLKLLPKLAKIHKEMGEKFHYVGVCAGGFLATEKSELYVALHDQFDRWSGFFSEPAYSGKFKFSGLIQDYQSIGTFFPNNDYSGMTSLPSLMPYRVKLSLPSSNKNLYLVHACGPAFIPVEEKQMSSESTVVACYSDKPSYSFFKPTETLKTPAAILSQPATAEHGARFISGVHIEGSVPNSKVLAFCKTSHPQFFWGKLNDDAIKAFEAEQKDTQATVESMLSAVLKRS